MHVGCSSCGTRMDVFDGMANPDAALVDWAGRPNQAHCAHCGEFKDAIKIDDHDPRGAEKAERV